LKLHNLVEISRESTSVETTEIYAGPDSSLLFGGQT
jgi:hypothetical protein